MTAWMWLGTFSVLSCLGCGQLGISFVQPQTSARVYQVAQQFHNVVVGGRIGP